MRQRQPYLVLDMRTWTSDDKLSSSCLPSSARYAKAETGLLTLEYLTHRGVRLTRTRDKFPKRRCVFLGCVRRLKIIIANYLCEADENAVLLSSHVSYRELLRQILLYFHVRKSIRFFKRSARFKFLSSYFSGY